MAVLTLRPARARRVLALACSCSALLAGAATFGRPSILLIDGRNNHDWPTTTEALRATLESTGLFEVAVATAPELKIHSGLRAPAVPDENFADAQGRNSEVTRAAQQKLAPEWASWSPDFSRHAAVILNYNGPAWPKPMQAAFVAYVRGGGGVHVIHAANNGFAQLVIARTGGACKGSQHTADNRAVLGAGVWINVRLLENFFGVARAHSINVGKRSFDAFVAGYVYS